VSALLSRLTQKDEALLAFILRCRQPMLDRAVALLIHLGGATSSILVSTLLALGTVRSLVQPGRIALVALVASHLAVQVLKRTIGRPRPVPPAWAFRTLPAPDRYSFPSGHAAASLSLAWPLAHAIGGGLGASILALGALIGASRCYLALHYPADVLAGWTLALGGVAAAPAVLALF